MTTPVNRHASIFCISSAPSARPELSTEEEQYVQQLVSMSLDSILDGGIGEKKCKDLGQKIFDQAKTVHNGSSYKARDVAVKICNAIYYSKCNDNSLRKQYIERAWDGIGDNVWRWMA